HQHWRCDEESSRRARARRTRASRLYRRASVAFSRQPPDPPTCTLGLRQAVAERRYQDSQLSFERPWWVDDDEPRAGKPAVRPDGADPEFRKQRLWNGKPRSLGNEPLAQPIA